MQIASNAFGSSFRSLLAHLTTALHQRRQQSVRFCSPLDARLPNFTVQQVLHATQIGRATSLQNSPTVHTRHWGFVSKSAQPTYSTNGYSLEQTRGVTDSHGMLDRPPVFATQGQGSLSSRIGAASSFQGVMAVTEMSRCKTCNEEDGKTSWRATRTVRIPVGSLHQRRLFRKHRLRQHKQIEGSFP